MDTALSQLIEEALNLGASGVVVVTSSEIQIEDGLAKICKEPGCPGYGQSKSCPPYVQGPEYFREKLEGYHRALFMKIDVPKDILFSADRWEIFELLHRTVSGVERQARVLGFTKASGYAGGSCKEIFCSEHYECQVISGKGECRNYDAARPSMSGFGINVSRLFETAGWQMDGFKEEVNSSSTPMSTVSGLVLLD